MHAGRDEFRHPADGERRAERKAAGEAFRHRDEVGLHAVLFEREEGSRPTESGLDLVGDEKEVVLFRERREALEEGVPYQTLIASVGHKHVAARLVERL